MQRCCVPITKPWANFLTPKLRSPLSISSRSIDEKAVLGQRTNLRGVTSLARQVGVYC